MVWHQEGIVWKKKTFCLRIFFRLLLARYVFGGLMWFCTWCFQAVIVRKFLKTNHSSLSIKTIHQFFKNFGRFEIRWKPYTQPKIIYWDYSELKVSPGYLKQLFSSVPHKFSDVWDVHIAQRWNSRWVY